MKDLELNWQFVYYFLISCFVTIVDIIVCRASENYTNIVAANTIGVITGFAIQFCMTTRYVYGKRNIKSFIVFLLTFFIGLALANIIVYFSRNYLFNGSPTTNAFLISKGISIVVPFFVMYYLRKKWMPKGQEKSE